MNARTARKALRMDHLSQPLLPWVQVALFLIGALFWFMAWERTDAFDVGLYGEFALQFPAEVWAAAMMAPAAMTWVGLRDPVKHWQVACGSGLQVMQFCALGYSAAFTGGEPIIGAFCFILFAPLYAYIFWAALNDT